MLNEALRHCGLIAILRGIEPKQAQPIADGLYRAGFRVIEVPLNSPEPIESINLIRQKLPADCVVGAGTVYLPAQVDAVRAVGGSLIVMPHGDVKVIDAAKAAGLDVLPGVATATEAFAAFAAGANFLKIFPADLLGPATLRAWLSVLPRSVGLIPVGGISPENIDGFVRAGAVGFGVGSALYKPGMSVEEVAQRAQALVRAWCLATAQ